MKLVQKQASATIPTLFGKFDLIAYSDNANDPMPHLAIVAENTQFDQPVAVRIHSECMTGDVFGSLRCDCGEQLDAALRYINQKGGVVIYLRQEGRGIGLINKLRAYNLQDTGLNTIDANTHLGFEADARQYTAAICILKDLGINQVHLITNNPEKVAALARSEIKVVDRIPIDIAPHDENRQYLLTKKDLMGHFLDLK
jgi:GTP cyclohydrolase II